MSKSYKIAVFYYTQTQQLLNILKSLLAPLEAEGYKVIYKAIEPVVPFSFPWTSDRFYQAFPETRQEIVFENKEIDFSDVSDADLVIMGYQPWFLSPSIPFSSFLQQQTTQNYLNGKMVMTVVGSRNMWISAHDSVEWHFFKANCNWIGNIVLEDRHNNLVSVLTIFRWLIDGQKEASRYLPEAGVSQQDIDSLAALAPDLSYALENKDYKTLQTKIADKGFVAFHDNLYLIERTGYKMFGFWSKWILEKGPYMSEARKFRLTLFKYYLMAVIFVISPFGTLFFNLTYPLRKSSLQSVRNKYVYLHH
ncbi:MAG: hypothetical protein A2X18_11940 [Bacteroidetes bacterium GWF2_40_14]|nr:MAG: hypothetical protein A2X18_11940 [Bacteroidetes bacterium GWF2_40_14]